MSFLSELLSSNKLLYVTASFNYFPFELFFISLYFNSANVWERRKFDNGNDLSKHKSILTLPEQPLDLRYSSYSGNAECFVQNGVFVPFSYRFRIVSFYAVSNAV